MVSYCVPSRKQTNMTSPVHCMDINWFIIPLWCQRLELRCVLCSLDRKRKGWAKRRRRQSGTKSSLKTLPKEDDSDDACENSSSSSSSFVCRFQYFTSPLPPFFGLCYVFIFPPRLGLISSSESSDGDDSEPESSNSGDSAFSEDINKMVRTVALNPGRS